MSWPPGAPGTAAKLADFLSCARSITETTNTTVTASSTARRLRIHFLPNVIRALDMISLRYRSSLLGTRSTCFWEECGILLQSIRAELDPRSHSDVRRSES